MTRFQTLLALSCFGTLAYLAPLQAQDDSRASFPAVLLGSWEGEGELFGRPARFALRWTHALEESFVRLEFANCLVEEGGTRPVLRAEALYRADAPDGSLPGLWADSRGELLQLHAEIRGDTLRTIWKAEGETGRTVYRPLLNDRLEVRDSVQTSEGWREFATARYQRVPDRRRATEIRC